jgi:hypothetical protein
VLQPTYSELKVPGWLTGRVARRSGAMGGSVQVILAGAALTDIVLRLLDTCRAASGWATRKTDIEGKLREFERAWEQETGEHLSTAAFYDRFCAGDFNTPLGERWASQYEATLGHPASAQASAS